MRAPRLVLAFAPLLLAACAPHEKPPIPPLTTAEPSPAQTVVSDAVPDGGSDAAIGNADPTSLTDDQKARDLALAPRVAQIVDAYSNSNAQLTKDGRKFIYRSSRDGVFHVYAADVAARAEEPKKLTTGQERVGFATLTPDERFILYLSDEGADEDWRIFRMKPDGSGVTNLTPGEKLSRQRPFVPRKKPSVMVYGARHKREARSTVFVQPLEGGEARAVYVDPQPGEVMSVNADGKHALVMRVVSPSESILFDVDLETSKPTRVYPQEGRKVAINDADYSPDGRRIFLTTDDGADGGHVLALEPGAAKGTFTVKARYDEQTPATAAVDSVRVAPSGDRIAIGVNAGNHSEVRILDSRTLKLERTATAPLGLVAPGEFSEDGKTLTLSISTPDTPQDVFIVETATGAVKPLREDKRPGLAGMAPVAVSIEKATSFDGTKVPINVYLPKGATAKLPTIVNFHGGPASSSFVRWSFVTRWFVSQGYAVLEPNIRGSTGFGRAYEMADNRERRGDAIKDVEAVNKWAKAQSWCDPERVIVYGGSYGGYIVLMALTRQPTLWRAGVDLVGVSNLKSLLTQTTGVIRSIFVDEFGDVDKDAALLDEWSPLKDADKITAPLFVYQGLNDPRVVKPESDAIVTAARRHNVHVEYMVANNEGHSLDRRENKIAFLARVTRFLGDELHVPQQ